jgi:hypothetical protein
MFNSTKVYRLVRDGSYVRCRLESDPRFKNPNNGLSKMPIIGWTTTKEEGEALKEAYNEGFIQSTI